MTIDMVEMMTSPHPVYRPSPCSLNIIYVFIGVLLSLYGQLSAMAAPRISSCWDKIYSSSKVMGKFDSNFSMDEEQINGINFLQ